MLLENSIYQKRKAQERYLRHYGVKGMEWDPSKKKNKPQEVDTNRTYRGTTPVEANAQRLSDRKAEIEKAKQECVQAKESAFDKVKKVLATIGRAITMPLMALLFYHMFSQGNPDWGSSGNKTIFGIPKFWNKQNNKAIKHSDEEEISIEDLKFQTYMFKKIASMSSEEIIKIYKEVIEKQGGNV